MNRKIFVNLPVRNLAASEAFFSSLGFTFNREFCDDTALCMVISEDIYTMLLTHDKFSQFSPNPLVDAKQATEVLLCLSCESRSEVDAMVKTAVNAGGRIYREPMDYGFMYGHSFQDLDGHVWELVYMEPAAENS